MKITDIEVIPIFPKLANRYAARRVDLYGIDCRVVYKVHTNAGITGYGDMRVWPYAKPSRDDVREVLRRGGVKTTAKYSRVFSLKPVAV